MLLQSTFSLRSLFIHENKAMFFLKKILSAVTQTVWFYGFFFFFKHEISLPWKSFFKQKILPLSNFSLRVRIWLNQMQIFEH